jgi:hypothetical protein
MTAADSQKGFIPALEINWDAIADVVNAFNAGAAPEPDQRRLFGTAIALAAHNRLKLAPVAREMADIEERQWRCISACEH